jgi:sporulation protein YlmC with PRC-barrel domain
MAFDNDKNTIERDETHEMISSEKVDGTVVYNRDGERLGTIHHFMVGKRDGRVRHAVLSFGGLFGMGERYHPLPWDVLTYDTEKGGYVVDLDKDRLEGAPSYERDKEPAFDRAYNEQIFGYYGVAY